MKKAAFCLSLIMLAGLVLPTASLAQDNANEETRQTVTAKLSADRKERIKTRCDAVKQRLNQLHDNLQGFKDRRDSAVNRTIEKLEAFAARAEAAGLDVTELRASIADLSSYGSESATAWDELLAGLDALLEIDCGTDQEAFHQALEDIRLAFLDVKSKVRQLVALFGQDGVIKTSLAGIRQQIQELKNNNDTQQEG
ncbi:MAG TPA: hypothetical protein VGA08_02300 [Candidatus Saccharimonadales bacterium]